MIFLLEGEPRRFQPLALGTSLLAGLLFASRSDDSEVMLRGLQATAAYASGSEPNARDVVEQHGAALIRGVVSFLRTDLAQLEEHADHLVCCSQILADLTPYDPDAVPDEWDFSKP